MFENFEAPKTVDEKKNDGTYFGHAYTTDAKQKKFEELKRYTEQQKPQKTENEARSIRVRVMKVNSVTGAVTPPPESVREPRLQEKPFVLNPPVEDVERVCTEKRSKGGLVIVDVGHGYGISNELRSSDVFVGIEPNLGYGSQKIKTLSTGRSRVDRESDVFVFESEIQDVSLNIKPNLVMCIAPHPAQIMDGGMFVAIKEKFLDNSNSNFLLVLERDSIEAKEDESTGQMIESIEKSFGEDYEVIPIRSNVTYESIPAEIMNKYFGVDRKVIFNSNSFQGEQKKTILKIRKKSR